MEIVPPKYKETATQYSPVVSYKSSPVHYSSVGVMHAPLVKDFGCQSEEVTSKPITVYNPALPTSTTSAIPVYKAPYQTAPHQPAAPSTPVLPKPA